jgi:hypothetical protein
MLDPQGFWIAADSNPVHHPAVDFDGSYLVAWEAYRSGSYWDIYGARVTTDGAVADTFPLVRQEANQTYPALVCNSSAPPFLVYQGWVGEFEGRSYNSYRIWGKLDQLSSLSGKGMPDNLPIVPGGSIVRDVLYVPSWLCDKRGPPPVLLDATGRKVMNLREGPNAVSQLAHGVYFIARRRAAGSESTVTRKLVILR